MSYDLMVFDPDVAPRDRNSFVAWYQVQTQWAEPHSYNDPVVSSPKLRAWFLDMVRNFPPVAGPYSRDDPEDPRVTEYAVGRCVIYGAYAWSESEIAKIQMTELAEKHGVGIFNPCVNPVDILFPSASGELVKLEELEKVNADYISLSQALEGQSQHAAAKNDGKLGGLLKSFGKRK